jgi:hypothetical protein
LQRVPNDNAVLESSPSASGAPPQESSQAEASDNGHESGAEYRRHPLDEPGPQRKVYGLNHRSDLLPVQI